MAAEVTRKQFKEAANSPAPSNDPFAIDAASEGVDLAQEVLKTNKPEVQKAVGDVWESSETLPRGLNGEINLTGTYQADLFIAEVEEKMTEHALDQVQAQEPVEPEEAYGGDSGIDASSALISYGGESF
jgi:hypothetical protein